MDDRGKSRKYVGRGAQVNPANRFDKVVCVDDNEQLDEEDRRQLASDQKVETRYLPDDSQSIVSTNNSPDLYFKHSLNPYRGCSHGCSYCYARTYHEFLGLSGGVDFETKIWFKPAAARLFTNWLKQPKWQGDPITLSGATDCYQGCERDLKLTRQCLEVALEFRQPLSIVTKNHLVLRDLDLLSQLAARNLVHVNISVTSLDQPLTKRMEPRTSSPAARLEAIQQLVENHVPTCALIAPIIPGLTDFEIPRLLEAVQSAGAYSARHTVLRLPGVVQDVFLDWLDRELPERANLIRSRLKSVRGGKWNDSRFHSRMSGEGEMAKQIQQTFHVVARRLGLGSLPPLSSSHFRRPGVDRQRRLF